MYIDVLILLIIKFVNQNNYLPKRYLLIYKQENHPTHLTKSKLFKYLKVIRKARLSYILLLPFNYA